MCAAHLGFLVYVFDGESFQHGPPWPQLSCVPWMTVPAGVMERVAECDRAPRDRDDERVDPQWQHRQ